MTTTRSLLVIAEDLLLGELIKSTLESAELLVRVVGSVKEAEAAGPAPDLVLIDPSIDGGTRWLEALRSKGEAGNIVAIVGSDEARRLADRAGLGVVDKRDGLTDLIHALRTRLNLHSLPSPSGHHILVVDDEEDYREMLAAFLSESGYSISVASDGQEAIDILDRTPSISVVLMDINMPGRGGLSALAEIVQRANPPEVIMTTAILDEQIARRAAELGAFDYILKPPDLQRVESTISACLSHRQYRGKGIWQRLFGS